MNVYVDHQPFGQFATRELARAILERSGIAKDRVEFEIGVPEAVAQIRAYATSVRSLITHHADPYQLAGWVNKEARARRMQGGTATKADQEILELEAEKRGRGEPVAELVAKQLAKSDALMHFEAVIDGLESAGIRQIQLIEDPLAVDAALNVMLATAETELQTLLKGE